MEHGFEIALMALLMLFIAGVAWVCYWGENHTWPRYVVLSVILLSSLLLGGMGALLYLGMHVLHLFSLPSTMDVITGLLGVIGLSGILSLIPWVRQVFATVCYPGLSVDNPIHTWSLFIFASAFWVTIASLFFLYNPELIAASLQGVPLGLMAGSNAIIFTGFSFIAAGVLSPIPFASVLETLGLQKISWVRVAQCIGFALILAIGIHVLEMGLMQLVSADMKAKINLVVDAMKTHGGISSVLLQATLVGLSAGLGEELLFRGLMQPVFGLYPTAILFALIHTHYGPSVLLLELFIVGVVLGYIRKKWSTSAAIIVHAAFDFFAIASSLFL